MRAPRLTLDIYEDALCPICAEFERQYGQQINQAIDNGTLAVNYHMLNFLNKSSFSGDYSSRAAAALLCVAQQSGAQPGVYLAFHSALFSSDHQPEEGGSSDLTNERAGRPGHLVGRVGRGGPMHQHRAERGGRRSGRDRVVGDAERGHRRTGGDARPWSRTACRSRSR